MKMSVFSRCCLLCALSAISFGQATPQAASPPAAAATATSTFPRLVHFSGVIKDGLGKPVTGPVPVTFSLYAEPEGGTALWSETQMVNADAQGLYAVFLGATEPTGLPLELFTTGAARWLSVEPGVPGVGDLSRVLLVGVPYALKAADADTLGGKPASAFVTATAPGGTAVNTGSPGNTQSANSSSTLNAALGGSGTKNFLPLWTASTTLGNSVLFQNGGNVGLGTTTPGAGLDVEKSSGTGVLGKTTVSSGSTFGVMGTTASSSGTGVQGNANATSGAAVGVRGVSASTAGAGVVAIETAKSGNTTGLNASSASTSGVGVYGSALATSGNTIGIKGIAVSPSGTGVVGAVTATATGSASGGTGVMGTGGNASGSGAGGTGLVGTGGAGLGNANDGGAGVVGSGGGSNNGNGGVGGNFAGATGGSSGNGGAGVVSTGGFGDNIGGHGGDFTGGDSDADVGVAGGDGGHFTGGSGHSGGIGIVVTAGPTFGGGGAPSGGIFQGSSGPAGNNGDGIDATSGGSGAFAGAFTGDVTVSGNLTVSGTKHFRIDHPLDPANKYLYHASVESSEVMNLYRGNITLDANGEAVVPLPDWFEALNKDFSYQLTAVGAPAPGLYIAQKIQNRTFRIAGGSPGLEVSWQVTAVRQDAWEKAHPMVVEVQKPVRERGYYLNPELFGAPAEKSIEWGRNPEMMRRLKAMREKQTRLARSKKPHE